MELEYQVKTILQQIHCEFEEIKHNGGDIREFLVRSKSKIDRILTRAAKHNSALDSEENETKYLEKRKRIKKKKPTRIVLYGFNSTTRPDINIMKEFFEDKMQLLIEPIEVIPLGKYTKSPLLVTLKSREDRNRIFTNLKLLKNFHEKGAAYSITDEMTKNELQKRQQLLPIFYKHKENPQNKLYFKGSSLYINQTKYKGEDQGQKVVINKMQNNASEKIAQDMTQEETGTEKLIIASRENNSEDMTQDFRIPTLDKNEHISSCIAPEKRRTAPPPPSTTILKNTDTTPVNQQKSSYENAEHANVSMISSHLKRNFSSLKNKIFKIN